MCLYGRLIQNPKYKPSGKNGGIVPPFNDERVLYVPIKCDNCIECRRAKAREWQIRMLEDIKENKNGKFVTLTLSDESIHELSKEIKDLEGYNLDNQIATLATRRFLERYRKTEKKSARHWLVTELGHEGTENIHLHGIIWTEIEKEKIDKYWKYGWIWHGDYVAERTVNYIIKYITKIDTKHETYKSIILTSAGIGGNYVDRINKERNKYKENGKTDDTYRTSTGNKMAMPIYWRNKIYTEEEREQLWIEKLNKEIRYIMGEKINTRNNEEGIRKLIEYHRRKNKQFGYGDTRKNEEKIQYENAQRKIMQETRIQKAIARKSNTSLLTSGNKKLK